MNVMWLGENNVYDGLNGSYGFLEKGEQGLLEWNGNSTGNKRD